jgi:hypothetical protein
MTVNDARRRRRRMMWSILGSWRVEGLWLFMRAVSVLALLALLGAALLCGSIAIGWSSGDPETFGDEKV